MCQEEKICAVIRWVPWGAPQARKRDWWAGERRLWRKSRPMGEGEGAKPAACARSACSLVPCVGASLLSCLPLSEEESPWAWSGVLGIKALAGVFLGMRAKSLQPRLTLCDPMDCTRLLCPWDSPGKNTGVGCHALLQGTFLTQGSNPRLLSLLHCRWVLYH